MRQSASAHLAYYEFDLRQRLAGNSIIRGKAVPRPGQHSMVQATLGSHAASTWAAREYICLPPTSPDESGWTEYRIDHLDDLDSFESVRDRSVSTPVDNPEMISTCVDRTTVDDTLGPVVCSIVDDQGLTEAMYRRGGRGPLERLRYHSATRGPTRTPITGVSYRHRHATCGVSSTTTEAATLSHSSKGSCRTPTDVSITSRSQGRCDLDRQSTRGPRDPGTYYLLKDGRIQTVGSRQPLFANERGSRRRRVHHLQGSRRSPPDSGLPDRSAWRAALPSSL